MHEQGAHTNPSNGILAVFAVQNILAQVKVFPDAELGSGSFHLGHRSYLVSQASPPPGISTRFWSPTEHSDAGRQAKLQLQASDKCP